MGLRVWFSLIVWGLGGVASASAVLEEDQLKRAIIEKLRQQEEAVWSAYCEFSVVAVPARDENLGAKIEEALRLRGEKPENRSVYEWSERAVKVNSGTAKWWRKGVKERWESKLYFEDPQEKTWSIKVFNGTLIKALFHTNGSRTGKLDTVETAHWNAINRLHPFSLIYEYYGQPWSRFLEQPENWAGAARDGGQGDTITVNARHPRLGKKRIEFVFDNDLRLLERRFYSDFLGLEPEVRLHEIQRFYDYRDHRAADGAIISFPHRADYIHYMGVLADGSLVETWTDRITIHHIEFNVDIPDEMFELELPKDIPIFDAVHTKGWINQPVEVGPTTKSRISIFFLLNGVLFAVLLILAGVLYYRRRRPAS
jgi:hypothetical protein